VKADPSTYVDVAAEIMTELRTLGFDPVLVGGMALVALGSRRVTNDFDFVVPRPDERLSYILGAFYRRGFELVSRVNDDGDVTSTIDNRTVAQARLKIDEPDSAYFYNPETQLRIDLLFDFPLAAAALAQRATRMKIAGHVFAIAAERDLLELKTIAKAARSFAGDAQDIAFLESRLGRVKAPGPKL
jgi:hypothetical protein